MAATANHTAKSSYTADELGQITAFAAGLIGTAREALDQGFGDDSTWDLLSAYAYQAAPYFISVAEMRGMAEQARTLVLNEARDAGNPRVL